ncbi:hypothetical protein [Nakamurella sp.]|uniref:hypothetical protein n=1 Tax=Nakamurella sp. TaxID=1869182 RepID=UPI00378416F8
MRSPSRPARPAYLRRVAIAGALLLGIGSITAPPAAAAGLTTTDDALQQAVDRSVANAAVDGIIQSISVVDRRTGEVVADRGGGRQYISESIVKLFTAAYYLSRANGQPDEQMRQTLRTMIENSDDDIESDLWNVDIVPAMADRYGLSHTANGPKTGPHDWGWELITADDETRFLSEMANDPAVSPVLLDAMAHSAPTAADGTNQAFGMNALTGDHGSKQGWTDAGAEWAEQAQIHSVGWTDRYFVAILETSTDSDFAAMTAESTNAARAVLRSESGDPAGPTPAAAEPVPPTATTPGPSGGTPTTSDPPTGVIPVLRHDLDVILADVAALIDHWSH